MSRLVGRLFRRPSGADQPVWQKCPRCGEMTYIRELEQALRVCVKCSYHFRLGARDRLAQILDPESFVERDADLVSPDPLSFVSDGHPYRERLAEAHRESGLPEAAVSGSGTVEGQVVEIVVCDFAFLAGTMGVVVGEKVARAVERATAAHRPFLAVAASGGARMHEGLFSLLQMAKTTAALAGLAAARVPYFCVLTDPTLGGVTASFASLADVCLAEPGALIGFAGPRVIEQVTKQKLPPDVNTAEFRLQRGFVDLVVARSELRPTLVRLLRLYTRAQLPEAVASARAGADGRGRR